MNLAKLFSGGKSAVAPGVTLKSSGSTAQLLVSRELAGPLTVPLKQEPLRGPGQHAFTVRMPQKGVRTAVGFVEQPRAEYLTPDYAGSKGYASFGGAGFIYPAKSMSKQTYGEGDSVECVLCFDTRRVTFSVNGRLAGSTPYPYATGYPAISVFPGDLRCEIAFE
ncbi:hypothetical protein TSOC_006324 [Tetrabaena socialis]|uniref:B30.2/SPRY domain-containing protein n=1 Tax=Tetrabaena socialis TaxID=47790 RepID=A0A2J8A3X3_9CHLO|nr:hypothetical protein TSOC_006324 [Tetrabaena socialis]|eukprot:PNH07221.1 hypothetical protein TSOC_006324 [Tetrabaena socialis]